MNSSRSEKTLFFARPWIRVFAFYCIMGSTGVGKTTLAQIIAQQLNREIYTLSAMILVKDVREVIEKLRVEVCLEQIACLICRWDTSFSKSTRLSFRCCRNRCSYSNWCNHQKSILWSDTCIVVEMSSVYPGTFSKRFTTFTQESHFWGWKIGS